MASIVTTGVNELLKELARLGEDEGPVLDAIMDTAIEGTVQGWEQAATAAGFDPPGKSGQGTGEMVRSIRASPVRRGSDGRYTEVYPQGTDSKGMRNAEKAFYNHYGTSGKKGIRATYWVDKAEEIAEPIVDKNANKLWADFIEQKGVK